MATVGTGPGGGVVEALTFTTQLFPRSFTTHASCPAHCATLKDSHTEVHDVNSTPKTNSHSGYASFVQFTGGIELHFIQVPFGPMAGSSMHCPPASAMVQPGWSQASRLREAQVEVGGVTGGGVSVRTQDRPLEFTMQPSCAAHCATVKASQRELHDANSTPKIKSQSG